MSSTDSCSKVDAEKKDEAATKLLTKLRASIALLLAAGYANLQARQLLLTQTAQPMGEEAVMAATRGLATAFSVGSMIEFFISPYFGRFSDAYGRRPLLLSLLVGPAVMRSLCVLVKHPQTRIRLLLLDFVSARTIGVQPTVAVAGSMISDAVPVQDQPRARAQITGAIAVGQIIGNYVSGWWSAKFGPESTFKVTAAVPAALLAFLSYFLPETHRDLKLDNKAKQATEDATTSSSSKAMNSFSILRDRECCLLAVTMGLYEFMYYPSIATVSNLFMKDKLGWNALRAGQYSSAIGLAVFLGSTFSARFLAALGSTRYVSFAHLSTCVSYIIWGTASSTRSMIACLFPMAMGTGASSVLMTRFMARASSLGFGKGEAGAVIQALGALARTLAPQFSMHLYLSALSARQRAGSGLRLPLGSPMLLLAILSLLQEGLYQKVLTTHGSCLPESLVHTSEPEDALNADVFGRQTSP